MDRDGEATGTVRVGGRSDVGVIAEGYGGAARVVRELSLVPPHSKWDGNMGDDPNGFWYCFSISVRSHHLSLESIMAHSGRSGTTTR